jgi:hypothetical protein
MKRNPGPKKTQTRIHRSHVFERRGDVGILLLFFFFFFFFFNFFKKYVKWLLRMYNVSYFSFRNFILLDICCVFWIWA